MKLVEAKVLILKPQANLLALIHKQIPDLPWKEVANVNVTTTAYVFDDVVDEVSLIAKLETDYLQVMQNEIAMLVGTKYSKQVSASFFDFLRCFKLELQEAKNLTSSFFSRRYKRACIQKHEYSIPLNNNGSNSLCLGDICQAIAENKVETQLLLPVVDLTKRYTFFRSKLMKIFNCIYNIFPDKLHIKFA